MAVDTPPEPTHIGFRRIIPVAGMRALSLSFVWRVYPLLHSLTVITALTPAVVVLQTLYAPSGWTPLSLLASILIATIVLDFILGTDEHAVPGSQQARIGRSLLSRSVPVAAVVFVCAGTLVASILLAPRLKADPAAFISAALVLGILNAAIGITAAHELIHRPSVIERALGAVTLAFFGYGTFYREHIHGHHRDAGTSDDPSTAKRGESIYAFLPRAIAGNIAKAWRIEKRLVYGGSGSPVWPWRTATFWLTAVTVVLLLFLAFVHSFVAAVFFLVHGLFAIATLETINYMQHYGLMRRRDDSGQLEPFSRQHAFNSPYWFTNMTLLHLFRHSDHHVYRMRPYSILRYDRSAPALPLPVFLMLAIAYVPPLWRWLMNPRVDAALRGA